MMIFNSDTYPAKPVVANEWRIKLIILLLCGNGNACDMEIEYLLYIT